MPPAADAAPAPAPARPMPELRGRRAIAIARRLALDPLPAFDELHADFGAAVRLRLPLNPLVLLYEPADVEHVLVRSTHSVRRGRPIRRTKRLLGNGLLTSEGDFHLRQRRMTQPAFQPRRLAPYADAMVGRTLQATDTWTAGDVIDVVSAMNRLTLLIAGDTMFGVDLTPRAGEVSAALDVARSNFTIALHPLAPLAERVPVLPFVRRFNRAKRMLDRTVLDIIEQRRASGHDHGDLLSLLLHARDDEGDGSAMTDAQLLDEALTLLLAGHETTANALSFSLWLLARHPHARERVEQEVQAALGDHVPTAGDHERLPFTRACALEALRLFPPGPALTRQALERIDLPSGHTVHKGEEIILPQWTIHHDGELWSDPHAFCPERFPGDAPRAHVRFANFPFGGGRRVCIGQGFAMLELVLVLATIAQRWRLEPATPDQQVEPEAVFTVRPRGGLPMRVTPRVGDGRPNAPDAIPLGSAGG